MSGLTLQEARALYDRLDATQRALVDHAFAKSLKAKIGDDMTRDALQAAADESFADAIRSVGGNA